MKTTLFWTEYYLRFDWSIPKSLFIDPFMNSSFNHSKLSSLSNLLKKFAKFQEKFAEKNEKNENEINNNNNNNDREILINNNIDHTIEKFDRSCHSIVDQNEDYYLYVQLEEIIQFEVQKRLNEILSNNINNNNNNNNLNQQ